MPEFTDLQLQVLKIIHNNYALKRNLTNAEIYKSMRTKPTAASYISEILTSLKKKGKIDFKTGYLPGHQGKQRIITIL